MYSKEEIRRIAEGLIDELRELPDGCFFTSAQLLAEYGYDLSDFGDMGLFDFHFDLFRAARANHIVLDLSAHEGKLEGLPFNLDFAVRNRRVQIKCPHCGSTNTARYLYGMPAWSENLQEKLDSGRIRLGGCCVKPAGADGKAVLSEPARHCNDCDHDF